MGYNRKFSRDKRTLLYKFYSTKIDTVAEFLV